MNAGNSGNSAASGSGGGPSAAIGGSSGSAMTEMTCGGELSGVWRFHQENFPTPPSPPQLDECSALQLYRIDGQLMAISWVNNRPAQRDVTINFAADGTYSWQQSFQGPISIQYPAQCRMSLEPTNEAEQQESCEDIAAAALTFTDPDPVFGPAVAAQATCAEDASGGCACTINVTSTEDQVGFWETGGDGSLILSRGEGWRSGAELTSYCAQNGTLRFDDSVLSWWPDLWELEFSHVNCAVEDAPQCQSANAYATAPAAEVSCGGDLTREWYAVQTNLPSVVPPQLDECRGLTLQRGASSLQASAWMPVPPEWRMLLSVSEEGTYASALTRTGTVELSYPPACLASDVQQETCTDVGAALTSSWLGEGVLREPLSCNTTAQGDCKCTGTITSVGGPAGLWATQEVGQITFGHLESNLARAFATTYCVDGETLRFRGDSGSWWRGSSGVDLMRVDCDDGQQGPFEDGPDCGGPCASCLP